MVIKLAELAEKNILLSFFIKTFCYIAFQIIAVWNEAKGFLRAHGIGGKKYQSIKSYRNKHAGKRCFIIATGPSLTLEDLEKLKQEYTFGMNSICKVYDQTTFRPTYYGIQDQYVYDRLQDDILKYYNEKNNVFIADRIELQFKTDKQWNIFPLCTAYKAYKCWFQKKYTAKFSDDIYRGLYDGFSITYSLIEIAVYMGFKEIYLIGADCSFKNPERMHFAEHGVKDASLDTAYERQIAGYLAAKEYADNHGIKIYNATRGGELEVFERVKFDSIWNID